MILHEIVTSQSGEPRKPTRYGWNAIQKHCRCRARNEGSGDKSVAEFTVLDFSARELPTEAAVDIGAETDVVALGGRGLSRA